VEARDGVARGHQARRGDPSRDCRTTRRTDHEGHGWPVSFQVGAVPVVVLASTGARSGKRRETPLLYFTDGDDVILTASNYGGSRHPGWYHNLVAHPQCELRIGRRGGSFLAHEIEGAERDRLFALAGDLYLGYANYAQRVESIRTIRVLRLTPQ
jgi:deazaflavin-dependent oxidoreductase (nitroreductase family)